MPFDEDLYRRCAQGLPLDDQAGQAARPAIEALARLCLPQPAPGRANAPVKGALMPSSVPDVSEKWTSTINTVVLGATAEEGGTRTSTVTIGGAAALPFLAFEGSVGQRPAIAVEVWDSGGETWPEPLRKAYGDGPGLARAAGPRRPSSSAPS